MMGKKIKFGVVLFGDEYDGEDVHAENEEEAAKIVQAGIDSGKITHPELHYRIILACPDCGEEEEYCECVD